MTDRELLEKAAKAAGGTAYFNSEHRHIKDGRYWNPLDDDGDALRLAVELSIRIGFNPGPYGEIPGFRFFGTPDDPKAAVRQAIVRAAAHLGEHRPADSLGDAQ